MKPGISVQPVEALGYTLEFFHLQNPDDQGRQFRYYVIDEQYRPEVLDQWDLIGLCQQSQGPWLLDVRFMHIELEMFDYGAFSALQDTTSYILVNPDSMRAVITFFAEVTMHEKYLTNTVSEFTHFRLMNIHDFEELHLPQGIKPILPNTRTYRYLPNTDLRHEGGINVFTFPKWSLQYGKNQVTSLAYDLFRQKISHQEFEPSESFERVPGSNAVTFNETAFVEFLALLKQHSYEDFAQTSQDR